MLVAKRIRSAQLGYRMGVQSSAATEAQCLKTKLPQAETFQGFGICADRDFDQRRLVGFDRFVERHGEAVGGVGAAAGDAERVGQLDEVGVVQLGARWTLPPRSTCWMRLTLP